MAALAIVEDGGHVAHRLSGHPERPDRVEAIRRRLSGTFPDLTRLRLAPADDEQLRRVHSPAHLERVATLCARGGGALDADTYATRASDAMARIAAGGAVAALAAVATGAHDSAFAVMRPPGHHATPSEAMGFCLYNNIAIAIENVRAVHGIRRVAIVDIDVHHGNGTEQVYWDDPDVLYTSLHEYPFYPGTGAATDRGGPEAVGATVNVPLPAGTAAAAWLRAFDDVVLPALSAHEPELVAVSCGFDAHRDDPLADLQLDTDTYAAVAERLRALRSPANGRTAWVLEGGYDLDALCGGSEAVVRVLSA